MTGIAIVGMACHYPDADSPARLWENAVAGRRAFRRLPEERIRAADYWDPDPAATDRFYSRTAAVIEGYEFDRVAHKIAGTTYRSTDLTHWLALDVAGRALADAGFPGAQGLPRSRTGVIVGNTLTGEFARANVMRLRWPYVRRTVGAALRAQGWEDERLAGFLDDLERTYKSPFPAVDEDTLAGGLSNTIAGRICNYFDFNGGGYTVDGACSSSLLAVATACKALRDREVDVAIAGGVDLSIDPFELVGFAKTGALARDEMRVYDRRSNGFWPGEGCGMVVLMREPDAPRRYAVVSGWGISSDGKGGMTRPEVEGYRLALRRAYERSGFGIDTVPLFEGHGTGTEVGDANELDALTRERSAAGRAVPVPPAVIGSVKGMIGHTKAAAGVAGLIKTVMALHHRTLPPSVGCFEPHPLLEAEPRALRALRKAEPWPEGAPLRAGVTAMGFGGINTHLVLEGTAARPVPFDAGLAASPQDAELLLFDARSPRALRDRLAGLVGWVGRLSYAEVGDLAADLRRRLRDRPCRAAAVVSSPDDASRRLIQLIEALDTGETTLVPTDGRVFLGRVTGRGGRIGYLFPGQGSGPRTVEGALRRRFAVVDEAYADAGVPGGGDPVATEVAQPRIATGSIAGLRALDLLGVRASVAVGHSLGEIPALLWAGALDEAAVTRIAKVRGQAMAEHGLPGAMAAVSAAPEAVAGMLDGLPAVIAGYNGPAQTVVAGPAGAIETVRGRAGVAQVECHRLPVSHAFHSPLVAAAVEPFGRRLERETFGPVRRRVISTVTGDVLPREGDLRALLCRQITDPVRFHPAVELAAKDVDLFVEVGPGRVLAGLARQVTDVPAIALQTDAESLVPLLLVAGAAFVLGAPLDHEALFRDRLHRPLRIGADLRFFAGPCEQPAQAHVELPESRPRTAAGPNPAHPVEPDAPGTGLAEPPIEVLRRLVAERAELPADAVLDDCRLLDDLHLSSITVGQLVGQAARALGVSVVQHAANFATATLRELAEGLDEMAGAPSGDAPAMAEGAATWARCFAVELDEQPRPAPRPPRPRDGDLAGGLAGNRTGEARPAAGPSGRWRVFAGSGHPFAAPLAEELRRAGIGPGILVCLPPRCAEADLATALRGARAAVDLPEGGRFVLVQHGRGAAGLAKTLRSEAPWLHVTVVHAPVAPQAVGWILAEAAATTGFTEAHYDDQGVRRVPSLRAMPVRPGRTRPPLTGSDVILVTGGGKGITAECALALALDSGAALTVLGRSDPDADPELRANLQRMRENGVIVRYLRADLTDRRQVRAAIEQAGPVTAVLHGAGHNEPTALGDLDTAGFRRALAPKVDGLLAVLESVEPERLRLLVTFGSIIGEAGLRGEAHYATANEWLADLTRRFAADHPQCHCLCLEWSVWSGVGMGERLSVVESLAREGITAISPDRGVELLRRLVADPDAPPVVVISGRTGRIDTVRYELPELPLLRFVAKPLVRYHGVELVTELELNPGTDRYLADHLFEGDMLFPAVLGLEAMAQVAAATLGRTDAPVLEQVGFTRPIGVPPNGGTTIRIAAVVTDDDTVLVVIRSAETGFDAEHFRATVRFGGGPVCEGPPYREPDDLPPLTLNPAADLYGRLLFQGRRFRRLRGYHRLSARRVDADVTAAETDWFAGYLPGELLLGDPGLRDALMHGNQVCVPDATLLPIGIDLVHPGDGRPTAGEFRYSATEREQDGDTYVYDVAVRTAGGQIVERWQGLRLRAARRSDGSGPWTAELLGPYLERALDRVAVVVEPGDGGAERRAVTALAAGRAVGRRVAVRYRPDGRPETEGGLTISASHGAGLTLCVAAPGTVSCDVETVVERSAADWSALLGGHASVAGLAATEAAESRDLAATRVWTVAECLRKAGSADGAPLAPLPPERPGWVVFATGGFRIATFATAVRNITEPVVFAILREA